jgi:hypothetical protein
VTVYIAMGQVIANLIIKIIRIIIIIYHVVRELLHFSHAPEYCHLYYLIHI